MKNNSAWFSGVGFCQRSTGAGEFMLCSWQLCCVVPYWLHSSSPFPAYLGSVFYACASRSRGHSLLYHENPRSGPWIMESEGKVRFVLENSFHLIFKSVFTPFDEFNEMKHAYNWYHIDIRCWDPHQLQNDCVDMWTSPVNLWILKNNHKSFNHG
jgi:hypothetical protein